jgi:tetratricopeptide (TPR) repeat protein
MGCGASTQDQASKGNAPVSIRRLDASECAVSILWLATQFLKNNPDVRGKAYTAQQVQERVVKEAISGKGCMYAQLIEAAALSEGRPYSVVAMSPNQPVADLIEQLYNYFKAKNQLDDGYVWLEMFCASESGADLDLSGVLQHSQATLLAIDSQATVLGSAESLCFSWSAIKAGKKNLQLMVAQEAHLQTFISKLPDFNLTAVVAQSPTISSYLKAKHRIEAEQMVIELKSGLVDAILSKLVPEDDSSGWFDLDSELSRSSSRLSNRAKSAGSALSRSGSSRLSANAAATNKERWSRNVSHQLLKIAGVAKQLGRLDMVEKLHRQDLIGKAAVLGKEHPHYLASVATLTTILIEAGKLEEAEELLRVSMADQEAQLGPGHKVTLTSMNNLACVLRDQGYMEEAETLFRKTLKAREDLLGLNHADTLTSLNNLANFNRQIGNLDEAETLFREVLKRREDALGENHLETIASRSSLSVVLRQAGQLEEAEELQRTSLRQRSEALGSDHPTTLKAQSRLASVHVEKQEYEMALEMYSKVYEGRVKTLGQNHKDTIESLKLIRELEAKVDRMNRDEDMKQRVPMTIEEDAEQEHEHAAAEEDHEDEEGDK